MGIIGNHITLVVSKNEREIVSLIAKRLAEEHPEHAEWVVEIVEDEATGDDEHILVQFARPMLLAFKAELMQYKSAVDKLNEQLEQRDKQMCQFA